MNAASYQSGNTSSQTGIGLSPGSIVSIFGTNLAATTETASTIPLPTQLGGTSVGCLPLLFVSPGQIDLQMLTGSSSCVTDNSQQGFVVTTAAGSSDPYLLGSSGPSSFGVFTLDSSGCGQGSVLNVKADGSVSINSPSESVSPGDYISVFGTGLYVPAAPPAGTPTPASPLRPSEVGAGALLDLTVNAPASPQHWSGLAPGLIGVDQINDQVPATVREGCAVPLQISTESISQPVTISIRKGGGRCVDPPSAGYGQITWEKTVTAASSSSTSETDTLTVSLQASPEKQGPSPLKYVDSTTEYPIFNYFGPSCALPGYRSLDAGPTSVRGTGFGPLSAVIMPLQQGQVSGLKVYQAMLPAGTIQPGAFSVSAAGGGDVGAFQSTVQIGSGIQITTPLAGKMLSDGQPITVNWTGGDPNSWVTLRGCITLDFWTRDIPSKLEPPMARSPWAR